MLQAAEDNLNQVIVGLYFPYDIAASREYSLGLQNFEIISPSRSCFNWRRMSSTSSKYNNIYTYTATTQQLNN